MIPLFKPQLDIREKKAIEQVLDSNWIGSGPKVVEFENKFKKYTRSKNALATNSASAALHLACMLAGVQKGDEVVTPAFTFVATNHPILLLNAIPVFCDIEEETLALDPDKLQKKISKKTKAVIVVHYGGEPAKIKKIASICKKNNITLIEDCAHSAGSYLKTKHLGTFGDYGCFSFAAIKNITTGDGGMLIGKSKVKIDYARALAWSGISQSTWSRSKGKKLKWKYNVIAPGYKYQMNDIAASIGLVQLSKLKSNNKKRERIVNKYNKAFSNISWIQTPVIERNELHSYHNYAIRVEKNIRDRLSNHLANKGISTSVHYRPSHHYDLYKKYDNKDLSITEKVWKEILLLPIFPDLTSKEQEHVIKSTLSFKQK